MDLLRKSEWNIEGTLRLKPSADDLSSFDFSSPNLVSALFQSGYLTIKGYSQEDSAYSMDFPNSEVEKSFIWCLTPRCIQTKDFPLPSLLFDIAQSVIEGNVGWFVSRLRFIFEHAPYESVQNLEIHCRNVVWVLSKMMGLYMQTEYCAVDSRISMVAKTPEYCYVLELKLGGTAEEALRQIRDRGYDQPFRSDSSRKLILIGMNIDPATRTIEGVRLRRRRNYTKSQKLSGVIVENEEQV